MRVLAFSGVQTPWSTLTRLIDLQPTSSASMQAKLDLVIAVNANVTLIAPDQFARLSCSMFVNHVDCVRAGHQSSLQE